MVDRTDEPKLAHDVGGVTAQVRALAQGFTHEAQFAVLEIADAAVNELGRAARCPFREIGAFDKRRFIAARDRIEGDA